MSLNEALYRLKNLPEQAQVTAGHVVAIVDWINKQPTAPAEKNPGLDKIISEQELAEWLGQSTSSIQKWRGKGTGPKYIVFPKSVAYRVSQVLEWLEGRTVSSTAEASVKGLSFATSVPAFRHTIGDSQVLLGLEASIATEQEPHEFEWVEAYSLAADDSPLSLYRALGSDNEAARTLLGACPIEKFSFGYWFFCKIFLPGFVGRERLPILEALDLLAAQRVDANSRFRLGAETLTVAHLMADCDGRSYFGQPVSHNDLYNQVLLTLFDMGLDSQICSTSGLTATDVAQRSDERQGGGGNPFFMVQKRRALYYELRDAFASG